MSRKDKNCSFGKNLKMNSDVYFLRRRVMNYVYQAKNLLGSDFKRVDVRITETLREDAAGVGRLNDRIIWISKNSVQNFCDLELRYLVFHELGHAIFGAKHDYSYLMQVSWPKEMSVEKQNKGLLRLANKHRSTKPFP